MLRGMKAAARRARVEQAAAKAVAADLPGASLTMREAEGRLKATVVLPPEAPEAARGLAERLMAQAGADDVLVVSEGKAPAAPAAASPPPRSAHDDPLSLGLKPSPAGPQKSRPRGVRRVVAVASGKGGVGKSTIAARLALALAARGQKTGLLDLDVYGPSVPVMFGTTATPEVRDGVMRPVLAGGQGGGRTLPVLSIGLLVAQDQALAWRGPMVMGAVKQLMGEADWTGEDGRPLDWLVVDTPPGTGDAHLSMARALVIDAAVLVTTPSPLALADLRRGKQLFDRLGVPILGVAENMAGGPFGEALSEDALAGMGLSRLVSLPLSTALAALPAETDDAGEDAVAPVAEAVLAAAVDREASGG